MKEEKRFIRNRNRFHGIRNLRFFSGLKYHNMGFQIKVFLIKSFKHQFEAHLKRKYGYIDVGDNSMMVTLCW